MPRKSTASVAATEPNGDVSMLSEAPEVEREAEQPEEKQRTVKGAKKKERLDRDATAQQLADPVSIDDLLLPRSIIQRLAKGVLPPNTSIQKDAILALTKSATVFISMLASTANEVTERKTIQSQDVIKGLREIEMDQVMQIGVIGKDGKKSSRVEREVEMWESEVRGKRRGYRERVKARESGAGDTTMGTLVGEAEGEEHETKRQRLDPDDAGREGSAGPITQGTNNIKLNVGRRKSDEDQIEDDVGDEDADDSSEEEVFEDAEEDQDEPQADDDIDVDDESSRRKGVLAPDGRGEVDDSGDDSE